MRKGFFGDALTIPISLLIFSIVLLALYLLVNEWSITVNNLFPNTTASTIATTGVGSILIFDPLFAFLWFGLNMAAWIFAWRQKTHPIFIFMFILISAIFTGLVGVLANMYYELSLSGQFAAATAAFPIMSFIWNNLPLLTIVSLVITAIVTFSRPAQPLLEDLGVR